MEMLDFAFQVDVLCNNGSNSECEKYDLLSSL